MSEVVSHTCSLKKGNYVGNSEDILGETLKDNDCNVLAIDDNKNVECETKKNYRTYGNKLWLTWKVIIFVFEKGNEKKKTPKPKGFCQIQSTLNPK